MALTFGHFNAGSDARRAATRAFQDADDAYSKELERWFGKHAGDVRYTVKGKGEPGTRLRELSDAFTAARMAWEKAI